jgi:hypothetical protein
MDAPGSQSVWKIIPHFPSASITSTANYYREVLHFSVSAPASHPNMCSVSIGPKAAANIYLFRTATLSPAAAMIAMSLDGLKEYYETLKREGKVLWVEDIGDKDWGYRQFEIKDEDGNRLSFFAFLSEDE